MDVVPKINAKSFETVKKQVLLIYNALLSLLKTTEKFRIGFI